MIVLAADTSTFVNTVALCQGGRILAETITDAGRVHAERLLPTVDWVLHEAGMLLSQIDLFAVSAGPGSFTGLRIGVAAWKGLAFGAEKPLIAVPTLDAMARLGAGAKGIVCPLLDARMGEVYGAVYRFSGEVREKLVEDRVCPVERLLEALPDSPVWFLGDGAELYRERILAQRPGALLAPESLSVPRASAVAIEALAMLSCGAETDPARAEPVYLRGSQAEMNRTLTQAGPARI